MQTNRVPSGLFDLFGPSPLPYILAGVVLLALGSGSILSAIRKESEKRDDSTKERFRTMSTGLIVSIGFIGLGLLFVAIGLTKLGAN